MSTPLSRLAQDAARDPALQAALVEPARPPLGLTPKLLAAVAIAALIAYPFVQKYFVRGVMIGAIKG